MIDILEKVYNVLINDESLMGLVDLNNIKFNDYPDVQDITQPYIVLDDFDDPVPEEHVDGERIAYNYILQIDVFVTYSDEYNARKRRNEISQRISDLLWEKLNMGQVTNLGNEYDKDFSLYRSTRRYEAIFYDENY
ncbi:hypothetical protein [Staphylococcus chromogenes]|uniref:hypothetical protein n=1 Tax=Staphylococcus chromogenes TaxID=46126 RepID=UPI000D19D02F|nr:hypothetical protein [Staphylococcus chromogenes]MCE4965303.1 hypothetical protein [Staphylococcus chromogenes]MDT0670667.1 hypothetical protein [Staphylococcus chromogenes]PTF76713.1 hypothetical protein BUX97_02470 [Staphylococcus chromogenes]PTF80165.1 hypothetical protein BU686_05485 [Staphylococcus chromogenes]PTG59159.1 hypothetical protein BU682_06065 [Staphylococcus chromogenes]